MLIKKAKIYSSIFLFSLIFLTPIPNFGTDVYSPSLPEIAKSLSSSDELIKLSVSIYLIMYGIGQLFFGVLSDVYGRRKLLLHGLALFTIFSFIASYSNSIYILLAARIAQGLAVSIISVLTKAIITDKYCGRKLKKVSTYKVNAQVLSIILAPLLGSYIQTISNWTYSFVFLGTYGAIGWFCALLFIPETCKKKSKLNIKLVFLSLKYICSHETFMLLTIDTAILYSIIGLLGVLGPFILQDTMKYGPLTYGISALFCGLSYMSGSIVSYRLTPKGLFYLSSVIFMVSSMVLILSTLWTVISVFLFVIPVLLIMGACGLLLPRMMNYTLNVFRLKAGGAASAVFGALVMFGMGLTLSISGFVNTKSLAPIGCFYFLLCSICISILSFKKLYQHL
ncbi:MAG: hypothetical protein CK424_06205 [Legionella sp.]|nr:MAG: hypothetical protein CK424_06205 [Legionella sp.]